MECNSLEMRCTIGFNEGYNHKNEVKNGVKLIAKLWDKYATLQENTCEMYISSVVFPSKTIYKEEWGCPKEGEDTITIYSSSNPKYVEDIEKWKQICINIIEKIKSELKQSTVLVTFTPTEVIYLE